MEQIIIEYFNYCYSGAYVFNFCIKLMEIKDNSRPHISLKEQMKPTHPIFSGAHVREMEASLY